MYFKTKNPKCKWFLLGVSAIITSVFKTMKGAFDPINICLYLPDLPAEKWNGVFLCILNR